LIDEKITDLVFSLKEKGDYTVPIQTSLGWHIFRLVEKKSLLKFEEMAPYIRKKSMLMPQEAHWREVL
jgi:peptidyl-prolyl cis-trans isomerase SurA